MLGTRCACSPESLERIKRSGWMRLLPHLRAYGCNLCGREFLARKRTIERLVAAQRQAAFEAKRQPP